MVGGSNGIFGFEGTFDVTAWRISLRFIHEDNYVRNPQKYSLHV